MLLLQTFNRLSQELNCSDCRRGLGAVEHVLKYLVRPRLRKEPGLGAATITITERIRELGLDAKAEDIVAEILAPGLRRRRVTSCRGLRIPRDALIPRSNER